MDVEPSGQIQEWEGEYSQHQPDESNPEDAGVGDPRKHPGGNGYGGSNGEQGASEPQAETELGAHEAADERVADLGLFLDLDAGTDHSRPAAGGEHHPFALGRVLSHRPVRWGNGTGAAGPG